jgi:hypothetical protein
VASLSTTRHQNCRAVTIHLPFLDNHIIKIVVLPASCTTQSSSCAILTESCGHLICVTARPLPQVAGGWLQQGADSLAPEDITFEVVSEKQPTPQQLEDLKFAWRCVKHVKSNAIAVAKDGRMLGMGSGQPNRWGRESVWGTSAGGVVAWSVVAHKGSLRRTWCSDMIRRGLQGGGMRPQQGWPPS